MALRESTRPPRASLWLPLFAAALSASSLPGWVWGPMALLVAIPRIAYWEGRGSWWGDYLGGFFAWILYFSYLSEIAWWMPLGPAPWLAFWWLGARFLYEQIAKLKGTPLSFLAYPSLAGPLVLGTIQYLRSRGPMGGVPVAPLGLGLSDYPGVDSLVSVIGGDGFSLLLFLWGGWIYACFRRTSALELWVAPVLTVVLSGVSQFRSVPPILEAPIRCLAVQPNISVADKNNPATADLIFEQNFLQCRAAAKAGEQPDLLIWAETMYPYPVLAEGSTGEIRRRVRFLEDIEKQDADLLLNYQAKLTGAIVRELRSPCYLVASCHFYQTVPKSAPEDVLSYRTSESVVFDRAGTLLAHVPKTEVVPFGESLPFYGAFPGGSAVARWIYDFSGLLPTFKHEPQADPVRLLPPKAEEQNPEPWVVGLTVCWENMYERVFRQQSLAGAECFLILSNEAWYGVGAEMDQMMAATRFRIAETGRPVLRATNNGQTALFDAYGKVVSDLPRGVQGRLLADLTRIAGTYRTPYLSGWWVVAPLLAGLTLVVGVVGGTWGRIRHDR